MRSLFVISLPRSLSSVVYQAARTALKLAEPGWVSDGEILNNDRYVTCGDSLQQKGRKFTRPRREQRVAARLYAFLDQIVQRDDFAYKDVVQPFVISEWLQRNGAGLAVLRIRRPLADVASSMLDRGWLYPAKGPLGPHNENAATALLRGLLDAQIALDAVPAVDVDYDALIRDESALRDALRVLAPDQEIEEPRYVSAGFCEYRKNRLERRGEKRYQILTSRLEELQAETDSLTTVAPEAPAIAE